MRYMGSKRRIAPYILPIVLKEHVGQYVEPFVGGANVFDKVRGPRIGADLNPYLIAALEWIRDDPTTLPRTLSEVQYELIREDKDHNPALTGYVGFALSYGGKWFGGYGRNNNSRDYGVEAYNNAQAQSIELRGATFKHSHYRNLSIQAGSTVYCDPPYRRTTGWDFNHVAFWTWCRELAARGCKVFISEYTAPEDFTCVWSRAITSSLTQDSGAKEGIERLYTL